MLDYKDKEDILELIKKLKLNDFVTLRNLKHSELEKIYPSLMLILCFQIIIIILILKVLV